MFLRLPVSLIPCTTSGVAFVTTEMASEHWIPVCEAKRLYGVLLVGAWVAALSALQGTAATLIVNNVSDSGPGSLRQAILDANATNGLDTIIFNIPGAGVQTIAPGSALPTITGPVVIDGTTQPNYAGTPLIVINGANAGITTDGLRLTGGNSTILGMAIAGFGGAGLHIQAPGGTNVIQGNFIGTDATGTLGQGNGQGLTQAGGVWLDGSSGNLIGGPYATNGNVISGNGGSGLYLQYGGGNIIQGNLFGVSVSGASALGNSSDGITLSSASGNQVGGTSAAVRNVISGNGGSGISVLAGATGNLVQGNYIGTDASGTVAIANAGDGVTISSSAGNTVGGTGAGAGNLLSGNSQGGMGLKGAGVDSNVIQGNLIGTDASGRVALGNTLSGITIIGGNSNVVGGTTMAARNIISANKLAGVYITTNSVGNLVQGNFIGVDATGANALGNAVDGVSIGGTSSNTIGGTVAGAGNVISGNAGHGIEILYAVATGNLIQGNYIGTNVTGQSAVANHLCGVHIQSQENTIGGSASGAGNLISGNWEHGIFLDGINASVASNLVQGNFIGTAAGGTNGLGNGLAGIVTYGTAPGNTIGGTTTGAGNLISANGDAGIYLMTSGAGNLIQGNRIGTDVTGTLALGNTFEGIYLNCAPSNTIGGVVAGAGNVISGNHTRGVLLTNASWNVIQANLIGTAIDGVNNLGNAWYAVECTNASNNLIGGTNYGAGNCLAFSQLNGGYGCSGARIRGGSTNDAILCNAIFSNLGLGIDLGTYGVNANIPCDTSSGDNMLQNYPVLTQAISGASLVVRGTLNSRPNARFLLQFFANPSCGSPSFPNNGQGQFYLGQTNIETGNNCNASFVANLPAQVPAGYVITATATDRANNTSEFSGCVGVTSAPAPPSIVTGPQGQTTCAGQSAAFSVTATGYLPLSYQWWFGNSPIAGATAGTFSLPSPQVADAGNYSVVITNAGGSITSAVAGLTVNVAPSITTPPRNQTNNLGTTATFTVAASGTASLGYQWIKNETNSLSDGGHVSGAMTSTLTLTAVSQSDVASYAVAVTNLCGSVTSPAALLVVVGLPPTITANPANQSLPVGQNALFGVAVSGSPPLFYQWFKNQTNVIAGATAATLSLSNIQSNDAGGYSVVVTNASGSATSTVATLTVLLPPVLTQQPMQTILTNGPVSNRLNVVVLSEGYTTNDLLAHFLSDATNAVNALLAHQPYQEYSNYFNAFAIQVASSQSGSDHPADGIYHDTYFNSTYDPVSDRLITIPPNFADTNNSDGQGKVDALLKTYVPECQLPILLVNDGTVGGSDGFFKTAIASTSALDYETNNGHPIGMMTHETGHVLAKLGDEYTYTPSYPGWVDTGQEEPNTTQQTNMLLIKWKTWISPDTPVPTPVAVGDDVVGLFQGAHYHTNGWYRPEFNCGMGSLGFPFCSVCSETLVLAIYQRVRPVDGFSPAGAKLSISKTQAVAFSLSLLQPATHSLSVQWYTNNTVVTGATNPAFTLLPQSLPNGTNWVSALVRDNTPLVRNDPTNLLSQTVTWALNVNPPLIGGAKPTVTITSPKPNANVTDATLTNGVFTAKGTAKSTSALVAVHYKLNSLDWETATGTTNWLATNLVLTAGANSFWAYAVDGTGVSRTNEVSFTYVVPWELTVGTNGCGIVTPDYNGQLLQIGKVYTMHARGTEGYGFTNWTDGFGNIYTNATLKFPMLSNLTLVANFADITKPVCAITFPAAKQKGFASPITAWCRAQDNVGVQWVYAQLNGEGWTNAISTDRTNWSIPNLALQGTNVLEAYAEDAASNKSRTNMVVFSYAPPVVTGNAPATLSGLAGEVVGMTGETPFEVSFDGATFASTSSGTNVVGAGNYIYTLRSSNTVQLTTVPIWPPTVTGNTAQMILTFTNGSTCVFTNGDGSLGAVTLAATTNLVPSASSLAMVNYWDFTDPSAVRTMVLGEGTFTNYTDYGQPTQTATNWGTYIWEPFSPVAAMRQMNYTDPNYTGTTSYVEATYTTSTSGTWSAVSLSSSATNIDAGYFTIVSTTNPPPGYAPMSLAGEMLTVTRSPGKKLSMSFGDDTCCQFDPSTKDDACKIKDYTYIKTGTNTGTLISTIVLPPNKEVSERAIFHLSDVHQQQRRNRQPRHDERCLVHSVRSQHLCARVLGLQDR